MSVSVEFIELRTAPRTAVHVPVICIEPGPRGKGDEGREPGTMVDQGANGAGLLVNRPFRLGQSLRLEGLQGGPRPARVRWLSRARTHYRMGVEFCEDQPGG